MQVAYARGHWQRPVWQGRFAGTVPAGCDDDSLVIAWLLLERRPPQNQSSHECKGGKGAASPLVKIHMSCQTTDEGIRSCFLLHLGQCLVSKFLRLKFEHQILNPAAKGWMYNNFRKLCQLVLRLWCAGDINWEGFTFQHGFRILRPRYEPLPVSPVPATKAAATQFEIKAETGSTPVKVRLSKQLPPLCLHHVRQ